jgi:hypothetical protein
MVSLSPLLSESGDGAGVGAGSQVARALASAARLHNYRVRVLDAHASGRELDVLATSRGAAARYVLDSFPTYNAVEVIA